MLVDFSQQIENLEVTLTNLSVGFTSCTWEAKKDGVSVETGSDPESFQFTALENGFYSITLTITGGSGSSTKGIDIYLLADDSPSMYYSILKQVDLIMPGIIETHWESAERLKIKWQHILFPAAQEADPSLTEDDMLDETKWPYFYNALIAQLIARDLFIDSQANMSGGGSSGMDGAGLIKKIVTGPTEAEWQSVSAAAAAVFADGAVFDMLNQRICSMAAIIGISFSFCKSQPFFPIKITPNTDVKYVNALLKYGASYLLTTYYN